MHIPSSPPSTTENRGIPLHLTMPLSTAFLTQERQQPVHRLHHRRGKSDEDTSRRCKDVESNFSTSSPFQSSAIVCGEKSLDPLRATAGEEGLTTRRKQFRWTSQR